MALRLFGKSDDLLPMLIEELGFEPLRPGISHWPKESRVLVPYDKYGTLVTDGSPKMWLDLSSGSKVQITAGHNIQGAKQPQYMHIKTGQGVVQMRDDASCCITLVIEGAHMRLGLWWLDAAIRGAVDVLPVVNQNPEFEGSERQARGRRVTSRA